MNFLKKHPKLIAFLIVAVIAVIVIAVLAATRRDKYTLVYKLNPDGKSYTLSDYEITRKGWDDGIVKIDLVIPETYEGLSVTAIGDDALQATGHIMFETVTIPSSITSIGKGAFASQQWLTEITIPDSVTSVGENAFKGCSSLKSATLPKGMTEIPAGMFSGNTVLTSVTIPDTVTVIGSGAFSSCSFLQSITLPNGVKSIQESAFQGCKKLTSMTIPGDVAYIGNNAFFGCDALTSVTFQSTTGWMRETMGYKYEIPDAEIANAATAATYLTSTYCAEPWYKN